MPQYLTIRNLLLVATLLRLAWLLLIDVHPVSDSAAYDQFAISLLEGRGFAYENGDLTAFWPVGTSAVYAGLYSLFGRSYLPIELMNLALGLGIVYFSWSVCRHYFNERIALLTAGILACWPLLIQFTTVLASELIFVFLMLLVLWLNIRLQQQLLSKAVLMGLTIGLACYIRPIIAPFIFILPILAVIKDRRWARMAAQIAISLFICAAVISPWCKRNTELFGKFTLISANFGTNFWMGNNPDSSGAYMKFPERDYGSEKNRDDQLKAEAIEFIRNNPGQYVLLAVKRLGHTFSRESIGIVWNRIGVAEHTNEQGIKLLKQFSTLYWYIMLVAAVAGALLCWRRAGWGGIFFEPLVLTAFFISIPLLTVGQDRYHMPMIPFIACYAAYLLNDWLERSGRLTAR